MRKLIFLLAITLFVGCEKGTEQTENTYPKETLKSLHLEAKAVQTKVILNAEQGNVISLQILAGEQLKEHLSPVPAVLVCVSGKGTYREASGETVLEPGDFVMIAKDVKHEVDAITDSNFILVK